MINERQPPRRVRHSDLTKLSEGSDFRVQCPACGNGLLLVQRLSPGWLPWTDLCVSCGQRVVYEDETIGNERVHRPLFVAIGLTNYALSSDPAPPLAIDVPEGLVFCIGFVGDQQESAIPLALWMPKKLSRDGTLDLCLGEALGDLGGAQEQDGITVHYGPLIFLGQIGSIHPWGVPFDSMPPWPAYQRIGSGPPVRAEVVDDAEGMKAKLGWGGHWSPPQ